MIHLNRSRDNASRPAPNSFARSFALLPALLFMVLGSGEASSETLGSASFNSAPAGIPTSGGPQEVLLYWREVAFSSDELPDELGQAAVEAIGQWTPWAAEKGYRLTLSDDERILLLSEGKNLSKNTWRTTVKALAVYDAFCPRMEDFTASTGASASEQPPTQTTPQATGVLIAVDSLEDYGSLLSELEARAPYLDKWLPKARKQVGFVLEKPLVAGWQTKPDGVEEWDPNNELAHRLGALMVLRDHGRMPHWLLRGLSWAVEIEATGGVYCFPDREEFVFTVEHGSWPRTAKNLAASLVKDDELIDLERLSRWQSGSWDSEVAMLAWAVAHWLVTEHTDQLPQVFHDLDRARIKGSTTYYPNGDWETNGDFQLSAERQRRVFARYLGPECEEEWTSKISGSKKKGKKRSSGR